MPNIFTTGLFKSPKYSSFPARSGNKMSARLGKVLPCKKWDLGAGDRICSDMAHLVRFSPLSAPVMDSYETTFDVHFIPYRLLDPSASTKENIFERFFNVYENVDGRYTIPKLSCRQLFGTVLRRCADVSSGVFAEPIEQSLYDYLGYAMYDIYQEAFFDFFVNSNHYYSDGAGMGLSTYRMDYLPQNLYEINNMALVAGDDPASYFYDSSNVVKVIFPDPLRTNGLHEYNIKFVDTSDASLKNTWALPISFLSYVISLLYSRGVFGQMFDYPNYTCFLGHYDAGIKGDSAISALYFNLLVIALHSLGAVGSSSFSTDSSVEDYAVDWSKVWDFLGISYDDAYQMWKSAVLGIALGSFVTASDGFVPVHEDGSTDPSTAVPFEAFYLLPSERVNLLPLLCYWRMIADWYVNLLVDANDYDADEFYLSKVNNLNLVSYIGYDWTPINRSWRNDYFTSAFPSPQVGQSVLIPVNGTMQDLRGSNSLITLKERLLYTGKKIKDVIYGIFGVHSSDARLDMTEVISRKTFPVNIQTITNVSASEAGKPLASLAGNGVGTGLAPLVDYTAEEPGMLFVVVSVRPYATYFQGLSRFLTKGDSVYDYVIPDFANVGMQEIRNSELYLDYNTTSASGTFGFTRRYAEFMYDQSEIHGSMRNTLLYWHSARRFSNSPVLGQEFMEVDIERDDLNRIFAVHNSENIVLETVFETHLVRPLPKYVRYNY